MPMTQMCIVVHCVVCATDTVKIFLSVNYVTLAYTDSIFSTTIFKTLNLTRQFESLSCRIFFTHFVNVAISGTKYFHRLVWQHMQGVVVSLFDILLQIS